MEKLEHIPISLDPEEVKKALRAGDWKLIQELLENAGSLIEGKAVYKISHISEKLEHSLIIDGIHLRSRVLRKNLDGTIRVFPFVVTIGSGLEERAGACEDLLEEYYLDTIGNMALSKARKYLAGQLQTRFALDVLSYMSPGSLDDWPIEEQRPLFSILNGAGESIGVKLTENLLMIPGKSVSGIFFPTKTTFYSCRLCPRKRCEGRKARYSQELAKQYGI